MSWAWRPASGSDVYRSSTLSFADASSAPLRTISQKVSPAAACVIRATLMREVLAAWPPPAALPESAGLPPVLEHALSASMGTTAATRVAFRHENLVTINLL